MFPWFVGFNFGWTLTSSFLLLTVQKIYWSEPLHSIIIFLYLFTHNALKGCWEGKFPLRPKVLNFRFTDFPFLLKSLWSVCWSEVKTKNVNRIAIAWIIDSLDSVDFYYHCEEKKTKKKLFRFKSVINLSAFYFAFPFQSCRTCCNHTQHEFFNSFKYWWPTNNKDFSSRALFYVGEFVMFLQYVIRFISEGNWFL